MHFPVSGVEISPLIPPLTALVISFFTSMAGVSGAFLLLPFQVSVLGFSSPAVSPTNLFYNIIGIPGGVYRFIREGRMVWPLVLVIVAGNLPGMLIGVWLRVVFLPDPAAFRFFVGCVLLYVGGRLFYDITGLGGKKDDRLRKIDVSSTERIQTGSISVRAITYSFQGEEFSFNPSGLFALSLFVGVVGGTYGIGGGAIIAPFLVAVFHLPVYTIAGATLFSTFLSSIVGVLFYTVAAPIWAPADLAVGPDWLLGLLFGVGGLVGTYLGARFQKFLPGKTVKIILAVCILFIAGRYVVSFFL